MLIKRLDRGILNLEIAILVSYDDIRGVGFMLDIEAKGFGGCGGRSSSWTPAEMLVEEVATHARGAAGGGTGSCLSPFGHCVFDVC